MEFKTKFNLADKVYLMKENKIIERYVEHIAVHFSKAQKTTYRVNDENYNIDEEDMEFENIFYQMEYYLTKNYGELITNTFIKNCGE